MRTFKPQEIGFVVINSTICDRQQKTPKSWFWTLTDCMRPGNLVNLTQ